MQLLLFCVQFLVLFFIYPIYYIFYYQKGIQFGKIKFDFYFLQISSICAEYFFIPSNEDLKKFDSLNYIIKGTGLIDSINNPFKHIFG